MRSIAASRQIADHTVEDRYRVAFQKNAACAVCNQPLAAPNGALFLESNGRLVHPGNCSAEALKHLFAYASRGLRGRKSHRGAR